MNTRITERRMITDIRIVPTTPRVGAPEGSAELEAVLVDATDELGGARDA